jgi:hypothetical protein
MELPVRPTAGEVPPHLELGLCAPPLNHVPGGDGLCDGVSPFDHLLYPRPPFLSPLRTFRPAERGGGESTGQEPRRRKHRLDGVEDLSQQGLRQLPICAAPLRVPGRLQHLQQRREGQRAHPVWEGGREREVRGR